MTERIKVPVLMDYWTNEVEALVIIRENEMSSSIIYLSTNYSGQVNSGEFSSLIHTAFEKRKIPAML